MNIKNLNFAVVGSGSIGLRHTKNLKHLGATKISVFDPNKKQKPFVEELGFNLHMFIRINSKIFKPMLLNNDKFSGLFHLFQLDCVYIKNFNEVDKLNTEELKKLFLILFWSFNSYDIVDLLISKLDDLTNNKFIIQYRELMKKKKIVKKY